MQVLNDAGEFLASDPVRHNLVLTLLQLRTIHPEPGRYWIVDVEGGSAGVVMQSPLHFTATLTPMPAEAVTTVVDAIVEDGVALPGVNGEAATAARFAGHWAERTRSAAHPEQGQRIYEVEDVVAARPASGRLRRAATEDRALLVAWLVAFNAEVADPGLNDLAEVVGRRLRAGELWVWDDGRPVAVAGLSDPVSGVTRVGPVYTPPEERGSGYASALVAAISGARRAEGLRCILYTDLSNPTSNSIYRAIGYTAVAEALRYRFDN